MTDKLKLTSTQGNVLVYLNHFIKKRGFPPTLREIAFHFGLKGPKAPQKTLNILERKGYIRRSPGGSRAIEILKPKPGKPGGSLEIGQTPWSVLRTEPVEALSLPVPIVGRVTAGEPILAIENIEGYIHLDRSFVSSKNVFLLRVQGDSMIEAHIQDGDFAMVRPQSSAEDGEIVVALIEDEATIKRIFKKRDLVRLSLRIQRWNPSSSEKEKRK